MRVLLWTPAIAIAAVIWILSSTPDLAIASGPLDTVLRKLAHVTVFGALAGACLLGLRGQSVTFERALPSAAIIALVYAAVDELHQTYVPTRHGSPYDVAIDAIGVGLVSLALLRVTHLRGVA